MSPEHSYLISGAPSPAPEGEWPAWMAHPEDFDPLPHVPTSVDPALVDVSEPMHVDSEGRLVFDGQSWHGCCLEAADGPHGDCETTQFINIPVDRKPNRREPFPVNPGWRNSG
jgi:hypothetical protein